MPITTPDVYKKVPKRAKENKFAYSAVNVTSSQILIIALCGLSDVEPDGIIQVSIDGTEYWPGSSIKDRVAGSLAMVVYAKEVAKNYPVTVALHIDHCAGGRLASWIEALIDLEIEEVRAGRLPFFQSHMFDGPSIPPDRNLEVTKRLLPRAVAANTVLEVETGVVGDEEDGVVGEINEKLYTATADGIKTVEALGPGERGHYPTALAFGNVHSVYKPGYVKLRPELLGTIQQEVGAHFKAGDRPFDLVMYGGSGSTTEEIAIAVANGVIKMNVDTDTQYTYTHPVADWIYKDCEGVLKVDGEVGIEKQYDLRAWGEAAEVGMATRVVETCQCLGFDGTMMK